MMHQVARPSTTNAVLQPKLSTSHTTTNSIGPLSIAPEAPIPSARPRSLRNHWTMAQFLGVPVALVPRETNRTAM